MQEKSNIRKMQHYTSADGLIHRRATQMAPSTRYTRVWEPRASECFGKRVRLVVDGRESLKFPAIDAEGNPTETEPIEFLACRLKGGQRKWLFTVQGIKRYYIDGGIVKDTTDTDEVIQAVEQDFTDEITALIGTEIVGWLWCNELGGQKRLHRTQEGFEAYDKAVQEAFENSMEQPTQED